MTGPRLAWGLLDPSARGLLTHVTAVMSGQTKVELSTAKQNHQKVISLFRQMQPSRDSATLTTLRA